MAFCRFCGGQLTAEDGFCPRCGTPVGEKADEQATGEPAPVQPQPVYMYPPPPMYAPVAAQSARARFCFPANSKFPLAAAITKVSLIIYSVIPQVIYFFSVFRSSAYGSYSPGMFPRLDERQFLIGRIIGVVAGVLISALFVALCLAPVKNRAEWVLAPLALPLVQSFASTITGPLASLSPVVHGLAALGLTLLAGGGMLLALAKKKPYWVLILLAPPLLGRLIGVVVNAFVVKHAFAASVDALVSVILGGAFVLCFYLAVTGRLRGKAALFALYAAMQAWTVLGGLLTMLSYGTPSALLTVALSNLLNALFGAVPVVLLIVGLRKVSAASPQGGMAPTGFA